jgi:dephospho-CoA kinase
MTFILGLTGSIGMGKSTTAALFRARGIPVHDSDAVVHALYRGKAAPFIEAAFPGTTKDGVVDRPLLAKHVIGNESAMKKLEQIVHPLVRAEEQNFLAQCKAQAVPLAVLDIPLLFETRGEARCDAVLVVTTDYSVQKERVLSRPDMTQERFDAILARQTPDSEKRQRAHFLIDTGHGIPDAARQVDAVLKVLAGRTRTHAVGKV